MERVVKKPLTSLALLVFRHLAPALLALMVCLGLPAVPQAQAEPEQEESVEKAYGIHGQSQHEQEHGAHGVDLKVLALQLLNFGILLFILIKYAGGALNKALRTKHDKMRVDLEEAQRLRSTAESRLKEQEGRLLSLEKDIVTLRQSMKESAESEKQRMIAAAEARVLRMEDETRFLLDQQVKQAELNFKAEVAAAASRIAEQILRRSVNDGDQQRLVTTFVAEVQAPSSPQERTA